MSRRYSGPAPESRVAMAADSRPKSRSGAAMSSEEPIVDFPMPRESPFDPPPQILDLLENRPISRVRLWNGQEPWLVTRYEDVKAVLTNKAFSSDVRTPGYPKVSASLAPFTAGLLN